MQNNPIRYNDPSGHKYCDSDDPGDCTRLSNSIEHTAIKYRIRFKGDWDTLHQEAVLEAVEKVGAKFALERGSGESASDAFRASFGHVNFGWQGLGAMGDCSTVTGGGCTSNANQINFWSMSGENSDPLSLSRMIKNVVHELGHAYDHSLNDGPRKDPTIAPFLNQRDKILLPNPLCDTCYDWQQHPPSMDPLGFTPSETFADMFLAWTYDAWNNNPDNVLYVDAAQSWMNNWLP